MARKITDKDVQKIVEIIDGWCGKLTYDKLIDATQIPLRKRLTRQALFAHTRIRDAFDNRKKTLRGSTTGKLVKSVELQKALERISRLESENNRLKNENEALLAQFVRWAYNAHSKGLSLEFLNMSLPDIDRRATKSNESKKELQKND